MNATPKGFLLHEGKISQSNFNTETGLKKSYILNTLLFKLYINDLPDFLNKESITARKRNFMFRNVTILL